AGVAQRKAGMAAAIIEFDALADAVRATSQDDDLIAIGRRRLVGQGARERPLIRRVHVGSRRSELGRTGVDALENWMDIESVPEARYVLLREARKSGKPRIREAHRFEAAQRSGGPRQALCLDLRFGLDDLTNFGQEPGVDVTGVVDHLIGDAEAHG